MVTPELGGWPDAGGVSTNWLNNSTPGPSGEMDMNDVSVLATMHFPELRDLPLMGEHGALDFLSFGGSIDEWGLQNTFSDMPGRFDQAFCWCLDKDGNNFISLESLKF
jgi:hypothetical protein